MKWVGEKIRISITYSMQKIKHINIGMRSTERKKNTTHQEKCWQRANFFILQWIQEK